MAIARIHTRLQRSLANTQCPSPGREMFDYEIVYIHVVLCRVAQ